MFSPPTRIRRLQSAPPVLVTASAPAQLPPQLLRQRSAAGVALFRAATMTSPAAAASWLASAQAELVETVVAANVMDTFRTDGVEEGWARLERLRASIPASMFCAAFVAVEAMAVLRYNRDATAARAVLDVALSGRFAMECPNEAVWRDVHEVRGLCLAYLDLRHQARDAFKRALGCEGKKGRRRLRKRLAAANLHCKHLVMSSTLNSGGMRRVLDHLDFRGNLAFAGASKRWHRCAEGIWSRARTFPSAALTAARATTLAPPRQLHPSWPQWARLPPFLYLPSAGGAQLWALFQVFLYQWVLTRRFGFVGEVGDMERLTTHVEALERSTRHSGGMSSAARELALVPRRAGSLLSVVKNRNEEEIGARGWRTSGTIGLTDMMRGLRVVRKSESVLGAQLTEQEDLAYAQHVAKVKATPGWTVPHPRSVFLKSLKHMTMMRHDSYTKLRKLRREMEEMNATLAVRAQQLRKDEIAATPRWRLPRGDRAQQQVPFEIGDRVGVEISRAAGASALRNGALMQGDVATVRRVIEGPLAITANGKVLVHSSWTPFKPQLVARMTDTILRRSPASISSSLKGLLKVSESPMQLCESLVIVHIGEENTHRAEATDELDVGLMVANVEGLRHASLPFAVGDHITIAPRSKGVRSSYCTDGVIIANKVVSTTLPFAAGRGGRNRDAAHKYTVRVCLRRPFL